MSTSKSGKWLAGFVLGTLFIVAVVVWSSARCPQEKLTELRGLVGQGAPQREMEGSVALSKFGQQIGKVRYIASTRAPRIKLSPPIHRPFILPLKMIPISSNGSSIYLESRMELEFVLHDKSHIFVSVQADTGSQYLVLMGDNCVQCSPEHGVFPSNEPGMVEESEMEFSYGIGDYTGSFYQSQLFNGKQPVPLQFAVASSATPCKTFFQNLPAGDTSCNDAIGGLLPTPVRAMSSSKSFLDQILGSLDRSIPHPHSFVLDYRKGKEQIVFGVEDTHGKKIPLLDESIIKDLFDSEGIPYYLVKLEGAFFQPDDRGIKGYSIKLPPYAIIDSGTTLFAASTRYTESIVFGRDEKHREATMANPAPGSLLRAEKGVLYLDFGEGSYLAAYIPGKQLASQLFTPLQMMDTPPFDQVLLVGLIALVGNVISHNIKEKYITIRRPECAPVGSSSLPAGCR